MLGSIAQDSKRKERYVKVVAGCKKLNGTIHALVENDKGEKYRVTLYGNGVTFSCRHEVKGKHLSCPSGHKKCYHIAAVLKIASLFTEEGYLPKEQAPRDMQYYYHDEPALARYDVVKEAHKVVSDAQIGEAYEMLAKTKKMQKTYGTCGHLVKPGQEGDLCGGCYQRLYA